MTQKNQSSFNISDLISHATSMQQRAIATYSNFKVGAALRSLTELLSVVLILNLFHIV